MSERPTQEQLMEIVDPFQRGSLEEALVRAQSLDAAFPDFPITQNLTGLILKGMGRLEEALVPLRAAVKLRPDYAEAQNNLGIVLTDLERFPEAATHFLAAIDQKPDYAEALNNLGCLMMSMDRNSDALSLFKRAITLVPNYAEAICNKGDTHLHMGQTEAAIACFKQALNQNPDYTPAHQSLSRSKHYVIGDDHLQMMQATLAKGEQDLDGQMRLNFALGKAYDDLKDFDKAFQCFDAANRARNDALPYDAEQDQLLFARIKSIFAGSVPELSVPEATPKPAFILGMPRSGTTLAEQIISSHSKVHGAGELGLMNNILQRTNALNELTTETLLRSIRTEYLGGLKQLEVNSEVITDKMPLNFRWIGFILKALPEAKIIHCSRDARAVCWSIYRHGFINSGNSFRYSLSNIAQYYHMYLDLMAFWHERFPGRILDMDYELLTTNQARETRRLLEFIDLEWDDILLDFHKNDRSVQTASATQVRQAMYQGSSDAWRNYEAHLGPLLDGLGIHNDIR